MKKLLVGLLFLFSGIANAGYLEDSFKAGSSEEMCGWAGTVVMESIKRQLMGIPFEIKDASLRPPVAGMPKDAIYIWNWDTLEQSDKVFYTKFIELGYEVAKNNPGDFPGSFQEFYGAFLSSCHQFKNSHEDWYKEFIIKSNLIRTGSARPLTEQDATNLILGASNQNLGKEPIGSSDEKYKYCGVLLYDINLIGWFISDGTPLDQVIALADESVGYDGFTQERHDRVIRQLKEAYALTTPFSDWAEKEYKECR